MKRFIVYCLIACFALLLVLPLAGCGKSADSNTSNHGSTTGGGGLGSRNKDIDSEAGGSN